MLYLRAALGLIIVYFAGAVLLLAVGPDLGAYSDIVLTCNVSGPDVAGCSERALSIAVGLLVAIVAVALMAEVLHRQDLRIVDSGAWFDRAAGKPGPQVLILSFLAMLTVVLMLHNLMRGGNALPAAVRIAPGESPFVSLENLCWPLLLQLFAWTRQPLWKAVFAAFLAAVAALSPFRAVLFAMLFFGAVAPLVAWAWSQRAVSKAKWRALAALLCMVALSAIAMGYETLVRERMYAGDASVQPAALAEGLVSRALTPFFQADLAAVVVARHAEAVPDFIDTMASKFRRDGVTNLNQRLYALLYQGGSEGQTTSMLYGEAVANSAYWPFWWAFSAPLLLLVIFFALRGTVAMPMLFAIALWRSAMGGLFDILPALILQVGFCLLLVASERASPAMRRQVPS